MRVTPITRRLAMGLVLATVVAVLVLFLLPWPMEARVKRELSDERIVGIARERAKKLGYPAHKMRARIVERPDGQAVVQLVSNDSSKLGGDLRVRIDDSIGEIVRVERGQ
jgi:hypothetical protein